MSPSSLTRLVTQSRTTNTHPEPNISPTEPNHPSISSFYPTVTCPNNTSPPRTPTGKTHPPENHNQIQQVDPTQNRDPQDPPTSSTDACDRPPELTTTSTTTQLQPNTTKRDSPESPTPAPTSASKRWGAVKAKLIRGSSVGLSPTDRESSGQTSRATTTINQLLRIKSKSTTEKDIRGPELTAQLSSGLLAIIMLKMAMDRDEHGQHRIPILMNYLKLKISDSIHPFHATHAVFKIELEYGDGLLHWVIYRELRDFVNLHAAYKASNIVSRNSSDVTLPNFPRTSLPYYNLLKREGKAEGKAEFARLQRAGLQEYLIKLTKATMFVPEANRLCKFLEISALSLALANRGGFQGKQGYLRIMSNGAFSRRQRTGFHPFKFKGRREPKWFIVRESYLISVDEPDQTEIYDIFLVDDEFQLKRPTRLLKQGIHLLDWHDASKEQHAPTLNFDNEVDPNQSAQGNPSGSGDPDEGVAAELAADSRQVQHASSHVFYITNSEREVKLIAKNERQMDQFIASIERMVARSIWHGKNRFDSYAPIRMNVSAQWLIDGRDYFWNLSKAILLAKERIYIHDWWLSPELYLRRPPAQNQKWRLDRLLERKANEGVQIFVIVYKEVSNGFTPVESGYTKSRLLSLSPNIHMQRSPSHTGTGNLLWSHHEKLCVIDETIAFMGGLDLCFGRWDTPGHALIDDASGGLEFIESVHPQSAEAADGQIWPGKDYSNQRVSDFFNLSKPEEDMYDRDRVPRQPWHDIGLQLIGQPARDLCRHFVQRWNYLLRTKNHTRLMPFLIPPSDFTPMELSERRIIGTCEAQICRSCGPWSIGTPNKVEHSIQSAYVKAIQCSEHFVYIENQFFITSCIVEGTVITNKIGDALVNRIIQAHEEGTPWKAVIIIPTMPGYPSPLNEDAAGSVRLIVDCQNKSICRGETSIFGRLRAEGINPNDYINFFSLRGWGKLKNGQLTTEGVYIHAKAMIVDDRCVIIGSANINERSQRGDRDSELACVIRDTDMIDSRMAGKPYKVGRFAHTMRVRLMREHLGIDVDAMDAEDANMDLIDQQIKTQEEHAGHQPGAAAVPKVDHQSSSNSLASQAWDPDREERGRSTSREGITQLIPPGARFVNGIKSIGHSVKDKLDPHSHDIDKVGDPTSNISVHDQLLKQARENPQVAKGKDQSKDGEAEPTSRLVPTLEEIDQPTNFSTSDPLASTSKNSTGRPPVIVQPEYLREKETPYNGNGKARSRSPTDDYNANFRSGTPTQSQSKATGLPQHDFLNADPNTRRNRTLNPKKSQFMVATPSIEVDPNGFEDPIDDRFYHSVWTAIASRNTQIFRTVFKCVPDDKVTTWQGYKEFAAWESRHGKPLRESARPASWNSGGNGEEENLNMGNNGSSAAGGEGSSNRAEPQQPATPMTASRARGMSVASGGTMGVGRPGEGHSRAATTAAESDNLNSSTQTGHSKEPTGTAALAASTGTISKSGTTTRKKSVGSTSKSAESKKAVDDRAGFTAVERDQMEEMLTEVQGHLVLFPTRFMENEDLNNNFLFQKDRIPPLAIYN
ncbi:Phospholipase D1 [Puccinia graminis f. sp. tritici]|uniref:Phospholipase n=1 Tax=Puccinia graminis f. sp. tritici TaxID=56615 RepID=A0A5B0NQC1_PUCGR|nr:Phospholipase D1 [Puccinia graminis f. sp. tritici]